MALATKTLPPSRQRIPERLRRPPHLHHVFLVFGVCGVQIGSAEGAILPAVQAHELAAAAAEAEGDGDAAGFRH